MAWHGEVTHYARRLTVNHRTRPSTPTFQHGAPPIPTRSARGRCAECLRPIYDGESARHVKPVRLAYSTDVDPGPRPYQHTECPK